MRGVLTRSVSSSLVRALPVLVFAALLALAACNKRKQPSPEYAQAVSMFGKLYGQKLDDAYVDPKMADVEALLQKVPADSADAEAARKMLQDIQDNRARVEKENAERAKAREEATQPSSSPVTSAPAPEPDKPPEPAPEAPDAGAKEPMPGMSVTELSQRFSGCFEQGDSLVVEGRGERETWVLKDIANCRDRFPGFDQYVIIIENGKIWQLGFRSGIRREVLDAGTSGGQDAGAR